MKFQMLDVVRIISQLPEGRVDPAFGDGAEPLIGDVGTVVHMTACSPDRPPAFLVESIGPEGGVRWLADIYQSELELVSSGP
ncbi:hypothetical protein [Stenotrophomonas rhizophila]|uniref:hypothetical protein n=1 Tax=Stenotrophomonas rhizophila TaxID=216778 RepID=UPI0028AADA5D|nr:hypothetical protein [Stenotrophomonas rhizophila]